MSKDFKNIPPKEESKTLYAALPVRLSDVMNGLHPLTQPGREILFFDTQEAAVRHALTSKLEGATQVAFTCAVTGLEGIKPTNVNPEAVGARTLTRDAAGALTMTVIDSKNDIQHLDVTDVHPYSIMSAARLAKEGFPAAQFPVFMMYVEQHEKLHDATILAKSMQQESSAPGKQVHQFVEQILAGRQGTGKNTAAFAVQEAIENFQSSNPATAPATSEPAVAGEDAPSDVGDDDIGDDFESP